MGLGKGSSVSPPQVGRFFTKSSVKVAWLSRMKLVREDLVLAKRDSCVCVCVCVGGGGGDTHTKVI